MHVSAKESSIHSPEPEWTPNERNKKQKCPSEQGYHIVRLGVGCTFLVAAQSLTDGVQVLAIGT